MDILTDLGGLSLFGELAEPEKGEGKRGCAERRKSSRPGIAEAKSKGDFWPMKPLSRISAFH